MRRRSPTPRYARSSTALTPRSLRKRRPTYDPRIFTRVAGTGEPGYSGDGGPATSAQLNNPFHCCLDAAGNLYMADAFNHAIRRVDAATGLITTVAGTGQPGYDGDGAPATAARLNEPYAVLVDRDGSLLVVDRLNAAIRRVDARSGVITTYAGSGQLVEPNAIDIDPAGNLHIADVRDCRVRKVDRVTGSLSTVAGTGRKESTGDGEHALTASLMGPRGVAFDTAGNLLICEREGSRIRTVDQRTGRIRAYAGTGERGYAGDGGPANQAVFDRPKWIHVGADGRVYVVDTENGCVRRIDPATRVISTVVGGLNRPHGCWLDPPGFLYVADSENHRVVMASVES